uniref:C2H2-type domain-containing protein n=1 Tax=Caenorhabditis tropicalis TaxID=1561998 RepID=A0A1I7TIG6_9PELO
MPPRKRKLDKVTKMEQTEEGHYKCHLCGQLFYRGCGLASHLRRHAPITYDCNHCRYSSKHKHALDKHVASAHTEVIESGPLLPLDTRVIKKEPSLTPENEAEIKEEPESDVEVKPQIKATRRVVKKKTLKRKRTGPGTSTKKRPFLKKPRIIRELPAITKKDSYGCPLCPAQFNCHQRAAFHIIYHRQQLHLAPTYAKYFSKKTSDQRGGFKMRSREMRRWRMTTKKHSALQRRDRVLWHMEQNFGHSIRNTVEPRDQDKTLVLKSAKRKKSQIDIVIRGVQKSVFRKNLRMNGGLDIGQKVTYEGTHYYFCRECPYTSWSASSLWRHYRNHTNASPQSWTCICCSYTSNNRVKVDSHVKLHKRMPESELEYSNWLRYERRVNKVDLDKPAPKKSQTENIYAKEFNTRSTSSVFQRMVRTPANQPEEPPVAKKTISLPPSMVRPQLQLRQTRKPSQFPKIEMGVHRNVLIVRGGRVPMRGAMKYKPGMAQTHIAQPQSSSYGLQPKMQIKKPESGYLNEKKPLLDNTHSFSKPANPSTKFIKVVTKIKEEPSTSTSSSCDSQPTSSNAAGSESSTPGLREPKIEDFRYTEQEQPGFPQVRHCADAWDCCVRAKKEYEKAVNAPVYPVAKINYPKVMLPEAIAQIGRNNMLEYIKRETEIENSRECADCPFKCNDIVKFRRHRDRHYNGGSHVCKECNYASYNFHQVKEHMFVDHYLSDVKIIEGYPTSESEDEAPPPPPPPPPPKPKKRKGRKRRANW